MRRSIIVTVLCVIAVAALAWMWSPKKSGLTEIKVGYGLTSDVLSVLVADREGIFAKHGIKATVSPVAGGSSLNAGLFSGSMQMIMSNPAALLNAVNGGLDFVVIAGGPRMTRSTDPIGLVLRSDLNYTAPTDLIGKKIAVTSFDSGMFFLLEKWLRQTGVDQKRVEFVEASMAQMGDLLKSKQVDGATVAEPFLSKVEADGVGKLVERYYTEIVPNQPTLFWIAKESWAKNNAATIAAIRSSLKDSETFILANPERARAIEKEVFKTNRKELPTADSTVTVADIDVYYQIGKELGVYQKDIDVTKLIFPPTQ